MEWLSCWLAEHVVRGSNTGPVTSISEIGYLLLPSCDTTEGLFMRRKILKTTQPTN